MRAKKKTHETADYLFTCRYCGKKLESDSSDWEKYQPFCSDRCKLADLDCWFEGEYGIEIKPLEEDDSPGQ